MDSIQMPLHGLSDLSSDAESEKQDFAEPVEQFGMGGGSRFLKKSGNRPSSPAGTSEVKFITQRGSQSMALSRVTHIEERIRNRANNRLGIDTGAEIRSSLSVQSSSELSAADGSRFLKKKASTPKGQESQKPCADIYLAPARSVSRMQKAASMDSDEEDMRRLLGESFDSPDGVKGMRQTETSAQCTVQVMLPLQCVLHIHSTGHKRCTCFQRASCLSVCFVCRFFLIF